MPFLVTSTLRLLDANRISRLQPSILGFAIPYDKYRITAPARLHATAGDHNCRGSEPDSAHELRASGSPSGHQALPLQDGLPKHG